MNSPQADLMAIGSHCTYPGCHQKDFLPFRCDCCHQVFCLDHRSYANHECSQARGKQCVVVVCPLCQQSIHLAGDDDVHEAFERHCRSGTCDPANYERVRNKPRCPVPHCNAKLTEATTYTCKDCGVKVCMAHRFESDHGCKERKAARHRARLPFHESIGRHATSMSQSATSAISRLAKMTGSQMTNSSATRPDLKGAGAREVCPHCNMRFQHVEDLVAHVASVHHGCAPRTVAIDGNQSQGNQAGLERCPQCGQTFSDPVMLVRHVQAHEYEQHVASREGKSECVIS